MTMEENKVIQNTEENKAIEDNWVRPEYRPRPEFKPTDLSTIDFSKYAKQVEPRIEFHGIFEILND
jgi:hypothetical protein